MADDTLRAIDHFFDTLDRGVEAADRVLNRGKHTDEQIRDRARRVKRPEVIDATATAKVKTEPEATKETAKTATKAPTAVAKRPHFYVVEAIDPRSGGTLFVVTDGGNARAECATRELAEQIVRALEKAP